MCCEGVCCPEGQTCVDGVCSPCPSGRVQCGDICCPEGQVCVDGVCVNPCPEERQCGDNCCEEWQYCCGGVCSDTPCCGEDTACDVGQICCNSRCCDFVGCDWFLTCDPHPYDGITETYCDNFVAFTAIYQGVYVIPATPRYPEFEGQLRVSQTVQRSVPNGGGSATVPVGLVWKAGYPQALQAFGCPWALVTDMAYSSCGRLLENNPFSDLEIGEVINRKVRLLRADCDGNVTDITSTAIEADPNAVANGVECWASTDIERLYVSCDYVRLGYACNNPANPPILPFFPEPFFACPP